MQNVECKVELRDPELCRSVLARLGAKLVIAVEQTDTYFRVPDGRLKRRRVPGEPDEWIFYHRQDRTQPKISHFQIYSEAEARARFGERDLPVRIEIRKKREIWMLGDLRVHLDDVERLGRFLEIEALVTPRRHLGICHREVDELLKNLGPILGERVSKSYADMVEE